MNALKILLVGVCVGSSAQVASANTTLENLQHELLQNNPQLMSVEEKIKAQESSARSTLGRFAPKIAVNAGYGDEDTHEELNQGYVGYLSGSWNIFNGGQDLLARNISQLELDIVRSEREKTRRLLTRQLKEIYFTLLGHKKTIDLLEDKSRFIQQQGQMAQKKINAGLTSAVDRIELDLTANSITLEKERLQSEMQQLTKELESLLNKTFESLPVASSDSFETAAISVDPEKLSEKNPEIQRQQYLEEISFLQASQARFDFLPEVNLRANYGRITPEYGDITKGSESQLFLVLTWELFTGFSKYHNLKAATYTTSSQKLEKTQKHLEIRSQAQNLITARDNLLRMKNLQEQRLSFAKKYYDLTLAEYRRGVKNSGDLEMATTSLFSSRRKLIELDRDVSILNAKISELI